MYQCERARLSKYGPLTTYVYGSCAILDQIHYNDRRNMCLWGFLHLLNSCVSNVLESRDLSPSFRLSLQYFFPSSAVSDSKWYSRSCCQVAIISIRRWLRQFPESENRDARALIFQINRIKLRQTSICRRCVPCSVATSCVLQIRRDRWKASFIKSNISKRGDAPGGNLETLNRIAIVSHRMQILPVARKFYQRIYLEK